VAGGDLELAGHGLLVQVLGLLQLRVVVLGAEPAHQHRLEHPVIGPPGLEPFVERGRVGGQPLLARDGDRG
jgi:hypothetical protein